MEPVDRGQRMDADETWELREADDDVTDGEPADDDLADEPYRFGAGDLAVVIVLGFVFAYVVYAAVGNLISFPAAAMALKAAVPWASLLAGVVLPVLLFVGGIWLGRGRPTFDRALILLAALGASCAASLSLVFVGLSSIQLF